MNAKGILNPGNTYFVNCVAITSVDDMFSRRIRPTVAQWETMQCHARLTQVFLFILKIWIDSFTKISMFFCYQPTQGINKLHGRRSLAYSTSRVVSLLIL